MSRSPQRDGAAAVNAFAAAIASPLDAETHFNHGVALQMLRYLGDAARAYQRALTFGPEMLDAHFNLGVVFEELGETGPSIAALEYVLVRAPASAEANRALLACWRAEPRRAWMQPSSVSRRTVRMRWGLSPTRWSTTSTRATMPRCSATSTACAATNSRRPTSWTSSIARATALPDAVLRRGAGRRGVALRDLRPGGAPRLWRADAARRHAQAGPVAHRLPVGRPARSRDGADDARRHRPPRSRALPILLYSTAARETSHRSSSRAAADAFVTLADLVDDDAVARIGGDDLDILVDLSTHTRGSRPAILARKPARVQITHVASAGAVGLSAQSTSSSPTATPTCRRTTATRSRPCCRWTAACTPFGA